ncbi:MAG: hypothetical protein V5A72_02735, partial [Candidatus Nanohaloarchaea archaeon]
LLFFLQMSLNLKLISSLNNAREKLDILEDENDFLAFLTGFLTLKKASLLKMGELSSPLETMTKR